MAMSDEEAAGEGVVLGGPSPKKHRPTTEGAESGAATQKWHAGALAAASKAPTFGKTTFAAAASGDVPGWLSKKPERAGASAGTSGSFFTSATNKVGTSSWLSGPSSAGSSLGTVGSGPGATTKPPAWLQSSSSGSASSSPFASKSATEATTAPPAWLTSSAGSAGASSSSTVASSSSLNSSAGLFSAASKGGGLSWLKPSGSAAAESVTAAAAATEDKGKSEGNSPAQDEDSSSPTKRRKYEEVGVRTGEESESCLQKVERVRLYHFRDGNWSERARECTLHLNETNGNSDGSGYRARIVIRTKETKSLVFNASLWPTMECQKHGASEKVTRICCYNAAETDGSGAVLGTYLISPSDKNDGTRLRTGIEQAKLKCPTPKVGEAPVSNTGPESSGDSQDKSGSSASSDTGTATATGSDAGTIVKLPTTQDTATPATNAPATVDSGVIESKAKESEAPAKKLKTSDSPGTVELAASVASVAATTAPAEVDAPPTSGSSSVEPEPPQQEEDEEDPDADL